MFMNIAKLRAEQASRTRGAAPALTEGPSDGRDEVGAMWRDLLVRGSRGPDHLGARNGRVLENRTRGCRCSCTGGTLLIGRRRLCNFAGEGCLLMRTQNVPNVVRRCTIGHRGDWRVASLVSREIVLWPGSGMDAGAPLHSLRSCSWVDRRGVIFARACRRVILHVGPVTLD